MAFACRLTSVRGNRGENYENEPWFAKNIQRKKKYLIQQFYKSILFLIIHPTKCKQQKVFFFKDRGKSKIIVIALNCSTKKDGVKVV
jgi:hypothetical protein